MPIEINESARLKLGINNNSMKSVTLPSFPVIKFQPLSPKFPTAPDKISTNENSSKFCSSISLICITNQPNTNMDNTYVKIV